MFIGGFDGTASARSGADDTTAELIVMDVDGEAGELRDMAEDADGYLWLATDRGLARYTGAESLSILGDAAQSNSRAASGPIEALVPDPGAGIWFADGTLSRIDPWTGQVDATDVPGEEATKGPDGAIWTLVEGRARLYDPVSESIVADVNLLSAMPLSEPRICSDDEGTLYVLDILGLLTVDPDGTIRRFSVSGEVVGVAPDPEGGVWISANSGLWRYESGDSRIRRVVPIPGDLSITSSAPGLIMRSDGNLAVALGEGGVALFDPVEGVWSDVAPTEDAPLVQKMLEDTSGRTWALGVNETLMLIDESSDFGWIELPETLDSDGDGVVKLAGVHYSDGGIWAALHLDGLARYDPATGSWTRPIDLPNQLSRRAERIDITAVTSVDDRLWIGTGGQGVFQADATAPSALARQLLVGYTYDVLEFGVSGPYVSWSSTSQKAFLLHDNSGKISGTSLDEAFFEGRNPFEAFTARGDYMFLGAADYVVRYHPSTDSYQVIDRDFPGHLESGAMYAADDSTLWLGSDFGIQIINFETGEQRLVEAGQGLPTGKVNALLPHGGGELIWVASNEAVSLISIDSVQVRAVYGSLSGLKGLRYGGANSATDNDGVAYLPATHGIEVLPAGIPPGSAAAPHIDIRCRTGCGENFNGVEVRDTRHVTFEFMSPDYEEAQHAAFEYRLGANEPWTILPSDRRELRLSSLPYGRYDLEARPVSVGFEPFDPERSVARLAIVVKRPWWLRSVTILIAFCVLGIAVVVALWSRNRTRVIAHRLLAQTVQERTESLERSRADAARAGQAKDRFVMAASHDLRSPLTGILGYADLLETTDLSPTQRKYLSAIVESGEHLSELVEGLLLRTSELVNSAGDVATPTLMVDVAADALDFVAPSAVGGGVALRQSVTGCEALLMVDRRGLTHTLISLLANGVYHSSGTMVTLKVEELQAPQPGLCRIRVEVADNGGTLSLEDARSIEASGTTADCDDSRRSSSDRIGLLMVTNWLAAQDSRLRVDVDPRFATSFWFDLDLAVVEPGGRSRALVV